jgi:hypothetical protein
MPGFEVFASRGHRQRTDSPALGGLNRSTTYTADTAKSGDDDGRKLLKGKFAEERVVQAPHDNIASRTIETE